ncbi:MAG: hypothetical protein MUO63_23005, partial [Desulfobulbaceae bacterium]|nr:hypothetical protein [Desulfobulbaceae bacterium]
AMPLQARSAPEAALRRCALLQTVNPSLSLWQQGIENHPDQERRKELLGIPHQYKENPNNIPDTLESQLEVLEKIGFREVDCYCKYGIFSLFGGCK